MAQILSTILMLGMFAIASDAQAHFGRVSKKDGCHNEKKTGKRHCHPERLDWYKDSKPKKTKKPEVQQESEPVQQPGATKASQGHLQGKAEVVDGDTLKLNGETVRLAGIDAPELKQGCVDQSKSKYPCGKYAKYYLQELVSRSPIGCNFIDRDRYGRIVAVCYKDSLDIGYLMVLNGHALDYPQYKPSYKEAEEIADSKGDGIHDGWYVKPWDWRKGKRLD